MRVQTIDLAGNGAKMPVRIWLGMVPRLHGRGLTLDGWRVTAPLTMTAVEVLGRVEKDAFFADLARRGRVFVKDLSLFEVGTTSAPHAWPATSNEFWWCQPMEQVRRVLVAEDGTETETFERVPRRNTEPDRYGDGDGMTWVVAVIDGTGRNHHRRWCWAVRVPDREGNPSMVSARLAAKLWGRDEYDAVSATIVAGMAPMCAIGYIDHIAEHPICLRREDARHPLDAEAAAAASGLAPAELMHMVARGQVTHLSPAFGSKANLISYADLTAVLNGVLHQAGQMTDDPPVQYVADMLGVPRSTMNRLSTSGRLKPVQVDRGAPRERDRIARESLVEYLVTAMEALERALHPVQQPA